MLNLLVDCFSSKHLNNQLLLFLSVLLIYSSFIFSLIEDLIKALLNPMWVFLLNSQYFKHHWG